SLTTESSQREPTRHGDLRETVHGTPHPDCGGLSYYALFGCTGRVSERRFSRPSDTPGAFTERHNRSRGPRTPPPASRNDLAEKRTMPETEHRLEGSGAELYDRHTFLRLPESFLHERQSSAWRERAVSGTSEGPASAVDLDRPIVTESEIVASTRTDPSPAPAASLPPAPPAPATGPTAPPGTPTWRCCAAAARNSTASAASSTRRPGPCGCRSPSPSCPRARTGTTACCWRSPTSAPAANSRTGCVTWRCTTP